MEKQSKSELNRSAFFNILTRQDVFVTVSRSVDGNFGILHRHFRVLPVQLLQPSKELIRHSLLNFHRKLHLCHTMVGLLI